jgi:hypothetical protein
MATEHQFPRSIDVLVRCGNELYSGELLANGSLVETIVRGGELMKLRNVRLRTSTVPKAFVSFRRDAFVYLATHEDIECLGGVRARARCTIPDSTIEGDLEALIPFANAVKRDSRLLVLKNASIRDRRGVSAFAKVVLINADRVTSLQSSLEPEELSAITLVA